MPLRRGQRGRGREGAGECIPWVGVWLPGKGWLAALRLLSGFAQRVTWKPHSHENQNDAIGAICRPALLKPLTQRQLSQTFSLEGRTSADLEGSWKQHCSGFQ